MNTNAVPVWPERCVEEWQTLFVQEFLEVPLSPLVRAGHEIIFSRFERPDLRSEELLAIDSETGRASRLIARAVYDQAWLDGDVLFYWSHRQIFSVPLAGGVSELLVNARSPAGAAGAALVTGDDLFWAQPNADGSTMNVWRSERGGGGVSALATFDQDGFNGSRLALGSGVLVAADRGVAIPLDGGAPFDLAEVPGGELLGVGSLGAYRQRVANDSPQGGSAYENEIMLSPADGGEARQIRRGVAGHRLEWLSEYGSGWLGTGSYYLGAGRPRAVIVYIEASGRERVLACHPGSDVVLGPALLSEGVLHAVTRSVNSFKIVRISFAN